MAVLVPFPEHVEQLSAKEQQRWWGTYQRLMRHEAAHVILYERALRRLQQTAAGRCYAEANVFRKVLFEAMSDAQEQFDLCADYGARTCMLDYAVRLSVEEVPLPGGRRFYLPDIGSHPPSTAPFPTHAP